MIPKLFLKLHRDREVLQCICQLIQSIYRRVDAFEAVNLFSNRQWHIIYQMFLSSNIHYSTAIPKTAFNKVQFAQNLKSGNNIRTHPHCFILLIIQLVPGFPQRRCQQLSYDRETARRMLHFDSQNGNIALLTLWGDYKRFAFKSLVSSY